MVTTLGDIALRRALQTITDKSPLTIHVAKIAAFMGVHSHSITLIEKANSNSHGFNCFMYALGIRELPSALVELAKTHDIFPDSCFIAHLVATRLVENSKLPRDGDIAIYFQPPNPKHAGIFQSGLIASKWGRGHLWQHNVLEVPASYGKRVRFFKPLTKRVVLTAFGEYAEKLIGASGAHAKRKPSPNRRKHADAKPPPN
jgi:hypothetical protein